MKRSGSITQALVAPMNTARSSVLVLPKMSNQFSDANFIAGGYFIVFGIEDRIFKVGFIFVSPRLVSGVPRR